MNNIESNTSKKDLELQAKHFVDFLNSEEFCNNPTHENLFIELTAMYNAAVQHAKYYRRRKTFDFVLMLYNEQKAGNSKKVERYKNHRLIKEKAYEALKKLDFVYFANWELNDEHEDLVYRSLYGDMLDIVGDIKQDLSWRILFPEFNRKALSVSDELFQSFKIHWGRNHCIDLIRALHEILKGQLDTKNSFR